MHAIHSYSVPLVLSLHSEWMYGIGSFRYSAIRSRDDTPMLEYLVLNTFFPLSEFYICGWQLIFGKRSLIKCETIIMILDAVRTGPVI